MCKFHLAENFLLASQENYIENSSMACLDTMRVGLFFCLLSKAFGPLQSHGLQFVDHWAMEPVLIKEYLPGIVHPAG